MIPVPILLYHSVSAAAATGGYRAWSVTPERFDEHLHVVTDAGFTPMTVSEFNDARAGKALPARPCLITFDDGHADFATSAIPVLRRHSMPATMYVVAGHVGGTSAWMASGTDPARPMMDWTDLRSLAGDGIEVGAHSLTHVELDIVPAAVRRREIVDSRAMLRDGLGIDIRSFAYPHGYHDRSVIADVRDAGFDSACAVHDRWSHAGDNPFALSRLFVWDSTTGDDLRRLLLSPPSSPPQHRPVERLLRAGWRVSRWARYQPRRLAGAPTAAEGLTHLPA